MHINLEKLDRALDRSLEAAIDPSLWSEILQRVADATGAFGVNIVPVKGSFPGGIISTDSLKPALEGYFDGGWDKREWRVRGFPLLLARGTVLEQHYTSREQFRTEEYYRAQSKYGLGRTCIVGLNSGDDLIGFVLHRKLSDDPFETEHEDIFRMMRDRLMVSATIMKNLLTSKVEGMIEAFETAQIGAVFFNRHCKVTAISAEASRCMGHHLTVFQNELRANKSEVTAQVRKRMHSVLGPDWLEPRNNDPILIEREQQRPLLLRIQRLGGNLPDVFAHSVGVCLIEDLNSRAKTNASVISEVLGLTQAEAALAMKLTEGFSLREAATTRSISYETARTHLRAIFDKTGVRRQSELIILVSRLKS
ncbi:helix-turn-helix transcriptional regulator [Sinorhizobium meliloti]|uniref:helix-turn-helix transcriptional regulator n=1 Tax=Rhizobium meliloti TaxID=382 RepID=UPI003D65722D